MWDCKSLVRGLKPLVFIIVFTGMLNMFFTPAERYLFELGHHPGIRQGHPDSGFHGGPHHAAGDGNLPDDLYHQPHPPDGWSGIAC